MTERITALRIQPRDNVATCVLAQKAGETAAYEADGNTITVRLLDDIPFGHKLAIRPIAAGGEIIKYGYPIGRAVRDIQPGEHVHIRSLLEVSFICSECCLRKRRTNAEVLEKLHQQSQLFRIAPGVNVQTGVSNMQRCVIPVSVPGALQT